MVSWNLTSRLVGRRSPVNDGGSQHDRNGLSNSKRSPSNKSFRIDLEKSVVHDHYCLEELSDDEYRSLWITAEEFMQSKQEYVAVIRMMMKTIGDFPETEDCCPRGLEFKTKDGSRRRKRIKQRACYAVLEEQDVQRDEGIHDPDFIAEIYKEVTTQASLEALNRGLKDQKIMLELLDESQRSQWEERNAPTKSSSTLEAPLRRRSITEALNGVELHQLRRSTPA